MRNSKLLLNFHLRTICIIFISLILIFSIYFLPSIVYADTNPPLLVGNTNQNANFTDSLVSRMETARSLDLLDTFKSYSPTYLTNLCDLEREALQRLITERVDLLNHKDHGELIHVIGNSLPFMIDPVSTISALEIASFPVIQEMLTNVGSANIAKIYALYVPTTHEVFNQIAIHNNSVTSASQLAHSDICFLDMYVSYLLRCPTLSDEERALFVNLVDLKMQRLQTLSPVEVYHLLIKALPYLVSPERVSSVIGLPMDFTPTLRTILVTIKHKILIRDDYLHGILDLYDPSGEFSED